MFKKNNSNPENQTDVFVFIFVCVSFKFFYKVAINCSKFLTHLMLRLEMKPHTDSISHILSISKIRYDSNISKCSISLCQNAGDFYVDI